MYFDIPVVFFIFKRIEKSLLIMDKIAQVKPRKIYIISDEGRDEVEKKLVKECRREVLQRIDWECEVVTNFADENRGCYDRIGLGALWVFSKEEKAIFLEDDNMPELTFFHYCEELLDKYEENDDILWICGTNYLEHYETKDNSDYVFTQHMHPCGWASWSRKFVKYYDKDFSALNKESLKKIKKRYINRAMYRTDLTNWKNELNSRKVNGKFTSWDYQMSFSLRFHNKLGIVPCINQITNIGVDNFSIHGGNSMDQVMTKRFCGMQSFPLKLPLKHPDKVSIDFIFERKVDQIVIPPHWLKVRRKIIGVVSCLIRKIFKIPNDQSIHKALKVILGGKYE